MIILYTDYALIYISSGEGEGPKITNALNYESNKEVDVVAASTAGGNFMMDFFNSAQGWKVQHTYTDLTTWTPITQDVVPENENGWGFPSLLSDLDIQKSK